MPHVEKMHRNLYNLYMQYFLYSDYNEDNQQLINKLSNLRGNLTLSELSDEVGVPKSKIIEYYFKGESDSIATSSDIIIMLMKTKGFRKAFLNRVSKISRIRVTQEEIDVYLDNFLDEKGSKLRIMPMDNIQNTMAYCLNSIQVLQIGSNEDINDEFYKAIATKSKKNLVTHQVTKSRNRDYTENTIFSPVEFFNLVDNFDKLQGYVQTETTKIVNGELVKKKTPFLLRSLLDVVAYLKDDTIVRYRDYVSGDGVFYDFPGYDKYKVDNKYSNTSNEWASSEYVKPLRGTSLDKDRDFYGREDVYLVADFKGGDPGNADDKSKKKQTYHRLVDRILTEKEETVYDFVLNTLQYSNRLTTGSYNSNSPLFKATTGYLMPPTESNKEDYEDLLEIFDKEVVLDVFANSTTSQRIPNNSTLTDMIKISGIVPIVEDMESQLNSLGISWEHLKPIYKEYRDRSLKNKTQFTDHLECYKYYRFFKYDTSGRFYPKTLMTDAICEIVPEFNSKEVLNDLKKRILFFKNPTLISIKEFIDPETEYNFNPDTMAMAMDSVFSDHNSSSLGQMTASLSKCIYKMEYIEERYNKYVERCGTDGKKSYSLLYALKYDTYVCKAVDIIQTLLSLSGPYVQKADSSVLDKTAAVYLRKMLPLIPNDLKYCIPQSRQYFNKQASYDSLREEVLIEEEFESDRCKDLRMYLTVLLNEDLPPIRLEDKYYVDRYGLYRSKSSNYLILEDTGKNALGFETRQIKNKFQLVITAYKEHDVWRIKNLW